MAEIRREQWRSGGRPVVVIGSYLMVVNPGEAELAAGAQVYVSGYNAATGRYEVTPADADSPTTRATLVLLEAIAAGASGKAAPEDVITGLDTSAATAVGDTVYLSATAGGWTLEAPAGDRLVQVVGVVTVKHADTGAIRFFPGWGVVSQVAAAAIPDGSVTDDKLATDVKVGSLALLDTTEKGSAVGAINEVKGLADTAQAAAEAAQGDADTALGRVAANQAASVATTVADLKTDLNTLLASLKAAGLMTADA